MTNPLPFGAETMDYGTVSGQGPGFKGKSEFVLKKEEISAVVMEIKQSSQKLNRDIAKLGTTADTEHFRGRMQESLRGTLGKVRRSKSMLTELVRLGAHSDERGSQLVVRALQQSLSAAVNEFQSASQEAVRQMDASDPFMAASQSYSSTHSDTAEVEEYGDRARLIKGRREPRQEQQQEQQLLVSDEVSHLEARANRMEAVETDIRTLNEIMIDIGNMVTEHGEAIDHIEGNVETAYSDVQQGNQQLEKGVRLKKCSRKLTCVICTIVGVIVAIFLIVIIIIIAQYVHKDKKKSLDY